MASDQKQVTRRKSRRPGGSAASAEASLKRSRAYAKRREIMVLGRFIVADPEVCHGQPTFRGTRVLVGDVLQQVARGLDWETIIEEWHDSITHDAIAEAVQLAAQALLEHTENFIVAAATR